MICDPCFILINKKWAKEAIKDIELKEEVKKEVKKDMELKELVTKKVMK